VLSRGERQAKEFIEESVAPHVRAIGAIAEYLNAEMPGSSIYKHEVIFGNGSRIIALPANPETARGYEGDITLDEFAFHQDARKIYEAIEPSITRGYRLAIISTPNGQQGTYYTVATEAGLVDGHARTERWSAHATTIHEAVAQGCLDRNGQVLDIDAVRAGCFDEEMWLPEYCCQFLSTATQWIPPELLEANLSPEATTGYPPPELGDLYLGWDIARNKHLSVIWALQVVGDVSWTRGVVEFRNVPTPQQLDDARPLVRRANRICLDKTGMGLTIAETLAREFGHKVEGITFTLPVKEALATHAKFRMERFKSRIPDTPVIRASFRSVKKIATATGHARFDAETDEKYGHADHWWAYALAETAAGQPTQLGLVEHLKSEAAKIEQSKASKPNREGQNESCPQCGATCIARLCNGKRWGQCGLQFGEKKITNPAMTRREALMR